MRSWLAVLDFIRVCHDISKVFGYDPLEVAPEVYALLDEQLLETWWVNLPKHPS